MKGQEERATTSDSLLEQALHDAQMWAVWQRAKAFPRVSVYALGRGTAEGLMDWHEK